MKDIEKVTLLAKQATGSSKQDHIIFKCNSGYDFCNPKVQREPAVREIKYGKEYVSVWEKGKELEKLRAYHKEIVIKLHEEAKKLKIKVVNQSMDELKTLIKGAKKSNS